MSQDSVSLKGSSSTYDVFGRSAAGVSNHKSRKKSSTRSKGIHQNSCTLHCSAKSLEYWAHTGGVNPFSLKWWVASSRHVASPKVSRTKSEALKIQDTPVERIHAEELKIQDIIADLMHIMHVVNFMDLGLVRRVCTHVRPSIRWCLNIYSLPRFGIYKNVSNRNVQLVTRLGVHRQILGLIVALYDS